MQTPDRNLRIEMFGNLVEELSYWQRCIEDEEMSGEADLDYCESRFSETLDAIREFRIILIEDLELYVKDCKANSIPVDLGYWRVKKQLYESTFSE
jgi:hypothetical protein